MRKFIKIMLLSFLFGFLVSGYFYKESQRNNLTGFNFDNLTNYEQSVYLNLVEENLELLEKVRSNYGDLFYHLDNKNHEQTNTLLLNLQKDLEKLSSLMGINLFGLKIMIGFIIM